jgi:hypothetical protein
LWSHRSGRRARSFEADLERYVTTLVDKALCTALQRRCPRAVVQRMP